ncbi:MAG: FAD-dependent oxidoreductase, partial [Candidatus Microsaccharimonas sp.]
SYGISKIVNYELIENDENPPAYFYDVLSNLQHQSDATLPVPYTHRLSFETMIIDTSIYLPALLADFQQKRGMLVQRTISNTSDIEALDEKIIFNCMGIGSKNIFPDDLLKPVKGVALLLKPLAEVKSIVSAGDFILAPRGHDLYLGASYNESYISDGVSQEEIDYLFNNVKRIVETPNTPFSLPEGLLNKDTITKTIVGFRPVRSIGPRVEKELVGTKTIIHNYGHGGNGIILSWGTSFSAVELLY